MRELQRQLMDGHRDTLRRLLAAENAEARAALEAHFAKRSALGSPF